jgi:hypothetical protein
MMSYFPQTVSDEDHTLFCIFSNATNSKVTHNFQISEINTVEKRGEAVNSYFDSRTFSPVV